MIRFFDRTLVLGYTQSGKSELVNHLFSGFNCQRVLLDTKDEWTVPGVEPVRGDPAAIDWTAPVIHVVIEPGTPDSLDHFDRLFSAAYNRPNAVVVAVHELADVCDYNTHRTPPGLNRYLSMGAVRGKGLLGASQRPVEMPKRALTEADHTFVFVPGQAADIDTIAPNVQRSSPELASELRSLHEEAGLYSFLWFDRRERRLDPFAPLPENVRSQTVVHRRPPVGGSVSAR